MPTKEQKKLNEETPQKTPRNKNLRPPWKKGESGNLKGRGKGTKNFDTIFFEAIRILANEPKYKALNIKKRTALAKLVARFYLEAMKGSYPHGKDILDRLLGKVTENVRQHLQFEGYDTEQLTEALTDRIAGIVGNDGRSRTKE
jgi:hypothetical protein